MLVRDDEGYDYVQNRLEVDKQETGHSGSNLVPRLFRRWKNLGINYKYLWR